MTTRVKIAILFGVAVFLMLIVVAPKASNAQLARLAVLVPLAGMALNVMLSIWAKK
jgi:hypothetical protein